MILIKVTKMKTIESYNEYPEYRNLVSPVIIEYYIGNIFTKLPFLIDEKMGDQIVTCAKAHGSKITIFHDSKLNLMFHTHKGLPLCQNLYKNEFGI